MKTAANILGLILLWACVIGRGSAEESLSDNEVDQDVSASENSLAALLATLQSQAQQQQQQPVQKRMSLEDFFLNRQQNEVGSAALPEGQLEINQPNPDSVVMVRDTNLPVVNGGVVSRLLLARRMLRLRRMIRRMLILPRILRPLSPLRRPLSPLRQVAAASPLRLLSKRIGQAYDDPYDPRDYVFGNKGYYDSNLASSQETSYNKNKQKQSFRNFDHIVDPYDLPHDQINLENVKAANNYEINDGKHQNWNKQKQVLNDVNVGTDGNNQAYDIQKIQEQLQLLQKFQQQNQAISNYEQSDNRPKYKSSQKIQPLNSQDYEDSPKQEYESNHEEYDNPTDQKYDSQAGQKASNAYKQSSQAKDVTEEQLQLTREQILQLLREQQMQILRDEQLKLQQLQQLQLIQQQQGQGYRHPQQYDNQNSNVESEDQGHSYQEEPYDQHHQDPEVDEQHGHTNGYETGDGDYENAQTVGKGLSGATPKKVVGVGVNISNKPPFVTITKPVSPVIKPLPPIVNPIFKPVATAPVEEALVPIGFLPKPILKLNGRLFFGAEAGKGVKIG